MSRPDLVTVVGRVAKVAEITTKAGSLMAFVTIDDGAAAVAVVVFPAEYAEVRNLLLSEALILVEGELLETDGEVKVLADRVSLQQEEPKG